MNDLSRACIWLLMIGTFGSHVSVLPAQTDQASQSRSLAFGLRGDMIGETLVEFRARNHRASDSEQIVGDPPRAFPRCSGDIIPDKMPERPSEADTDFARRFDAYQQAIKLRRDNYSLNDELLDALAHEDGEDKACTLGDGTGGTVAGVGASLIFRFRADRLDMIESQFRRENYQRVRAAIVARYGPPSTISNHEYRNKADVVFTGEMCEWTRPSSVISLRRFSFDLDESQLYILSPQALIRHDADQQQKANADF